jgi:hypothetical protein
MKQYGKLAILGLTLATVGMSSAQTITHWLDRQIHGTARHLTPRHHKPGEPSYANRPNLNYVYVEEVNGGYLCTAYTDDGRKIRKFYPYSKVERFG